MPSRSLLPPSATPLERELERLAERHLVSAFVHRQAWSPSDCPESLLGALAWALGIDHWSVQMDVGHRRSACAEALTLHRQRGTLASVYRTLQHAGYGGATVTEGIQAATYDGRHLHDGTETFGSGGQWARYRVHVDVGELGTINAAQNARLRQLLAATAPARCELLGVSFHHAAADALALRDIPAEQVALRQRSVLPWGRRYDGAMTHNQGREFVHDGTQTYSAAAHYNGAIADGACYDNAQDNCALQLGSSAMSQVTLRPAHDGGLRYNGAINHGAGNPPALDGGTTYEITHHRRYNGLLDHSTDTHSGAKCYDGSATYSSRHTYAGANITSEVYP
ncbi:MAG: phage tail protein I [Aeromonas sp.]